MALIDIHGSPAPDDDRDATVIPLRPAVPMIPTQRAEPDAEDAETVLVDPGETGGPVDPPDEPVTLYGTITRSQYEAKPPIVPAWLRNSSQRRAFARQSVRHVGYVVGFHAARSPKYAARVAFRAPFGAGKTVWLLGRWTFDREGLPARLEAVRRNDAKEYLNLSRQRDRRVRARVVAALGLLLVLAAVVVAGWLLAPWWALAPMGAAGVLALTRVGTPADKPITDRTSTGPKFTKLTAEAVRTALCSIGVSGIKDPAAIQFPPPGIHKDGPGWLARVNLPQGVEAVDVIEKRGKLSSALRLPVDQVWPAAGPEHAGQLDLWVGYLPASKMGQPRWSLLAENARTSVFELHEFGTDQRQRPVSTVLFERNFLVGGVPGSGKSYGARTLVTIAALDPTCELKIVEYKGVGDFLDFAPLCSTYAVGVDDQAFKTGMDMLAWGLAEAERRGERIRKLKESGQAPEGKVTPEIAARKGSGLHPVMIVIDEAHELFGDAEYGKEAAQAAERLIKRGRALGIIVVLATQIPDKTSLPPNITRCVTVRWCMAVLDQVANDMILGTGMYKRGLAATAYRPGDDAGWGIAIGIAQAGPVRSYFPKPEENAAIIARATALRGGVVGEAAEPVEARDILADVRAMIAEDNPRGLWWETIAERLAERWPGVYAGITAEMVRTSVTRYGVPTQDVKIDGKGRKGARLEEIQSAIARRAIEN